MRQVICDICGCIQTLNVNRDQGVFIQNRAGKMPDNWETIFVRRTVKKDGVVDLCPDCLDKYYAIHSGAQNTMDATVDAWMSSMVGKYLETPEEEKKENE